MSTNMKQLKLLFRAFIVAIKLVFIVMVILYSVVAFTNFSFTVQMNPEAWISLRFLVAALTVFLTIIGWGVLQDASLLI